MEILDKLPEEVMTSILSRLPVRSLIKFKCVCKSWYALVKSPLFIARHLHHINQLTWDSHIAQIIVGSYDSNKRTHYMSVLSPETLEASAGIHMPFFDITWHVVGICNGILCLCGENDNITLWNFATNEFMALPSSEVTRPVDTIESDPMNGIGFGFDSNAHEYKVVRCVKNYREDLSHSTQVELYNISDNYWKEIDVNVPESVTIYYNTSNTWLNGSYHWWAADENGYMILSFDMEMDVFKQMPLPEYLIRQTPCEGELALINTSLALMIYSEQEANQYVNVWVLNDYGVQDSWTKLSAIGPLVSGIEMPLGLWRNGELFYESRDGKLFMYDPKTDEIKDLQIYGGSCRLLQVVIYMESLVPIKEDKGR